MALTLVACGSPKGGEPLSEAEACRASLLLDMAQIVEDPTDFTPYADQRSHLPNTILRLDATVMTLAPLSVSGIARLGTISVGETSAAVYLSSPSDDLTYNSVLTEGGLFLESTPIPVSEDPVGGLPDFARRRATFLQISSEAAGYLSWDDPINAMGTRPHRVVWVQDGILYTLIGVLPGDQLVEVAGQVSCDIAA
jgi:hypothetical protein